MLMIYMKIINPDHCGTDSKNHKQITNCHYETIFLNKF